MDNGKIKSFKISPKFVQVKYTDNVIEDGSNTFKEKTVKIHRAVSDNFLSNLRTLLSHALLIGGLAPVSIIDEKCIKNKKIVDMPQFKNFHLIGFSLSKDDEDEEVSFILRVVPEIGGAYDITLKPFGIFDESYPYIEYLKDDISLVVDHVESFIKGANYWKQGNMFDDQEAEPVEQF